MGQQLVEEVFTSKCTRVMPEHAASCVWTGSPQTCNIWCTSCWQHLTHFELKRRRPHSQKTHVFGRTCSTALDRISFTSPL